MMLQQSRTLSNGTSHQVQTTSQVEYPRALSIESLAELTPDRRRAAAHTDVTLAVAFHGFYETLLEMRCLIIHWGDADKSSNDQFPIDPTEEYLFDHYAVMCLNQATAAASGLVKLPLLFEYAVTSRLASTRCQ